MSNHVNPFTDFVTRLQAMEREAFGLKLFGTARVINEAMNQAGYEKAAQVQNVSRPTRPPVRRTEA